MCSILNFLEVIQAIFVMLLFQVGNANMRCIDKERQALLDLKLGLVDDYGRLSSWGTTEDCCHWIGVQCNLQNGHVEELDLHDDQLGDQPLRGEIRTSLMELQHLNYLNLSHNNFNGGQIPKFFGSLGELRLLDLSVASFGGKIPYQLGKLLNLSVLDLSCNYLVGEIPYQLGNLSSLQELHLDCNGLVGIIPYQLGKLLNLSVLDLRSNNLVGEIPHQLGNISKLQKLRLGYNDYLKIDMGLARAEWLCNLPYLTELDLSSLSNLNYSAKRLQMLGKLPNLRRLWLDNCSLTDSNLLSMPPSHLNFSASLVTLSVSHNKFTSSIFPWLFNLSSNLVELYLGGNQLTGCIPDDFGKSMNSLKVLNLSDNELNGTVSDIHFDNLTELQELNLSYNSLAVKFSNNWIPPFQLKYLGLRQCKLGPEFPRWLYSQNNLKVLDISNAGISDSVPEWFWNLTKGVSSLWMESNSLTGTIPNLPLKFSNSPIIVLASNQIEGSLPSFLLNGAMCLDISNNKISEFFLSCDDGIGADVESLGVLDISNNKLSGQLPDCWNYFKSLAFLDLSNNKLSGRISTSMGSLFQIQQLILRNNYFSGELSYLENCTKLLLLDMGQNELSGSIPSWIGENLKRLEILLLPMNKLGGNLPFHLCDLTSVRVLDLSINNFTGPIPRCFKNFVALAQKHKYDKIIDEFDFYKEGKVIRHGQLDLDPFVDWKGTKLRYKDTYRLLNIIDLSHNQLSGEIPAEIGSLIELVSLNLSTNNLSGEIVSEIGQLKSLQVLDLSRNNFHGKIPSSLAELSFLSNLNLSYNNLSGEIPTGTQLQSFDASYTGNPYLRGRPMDLCSYDQDPSRHGGQEEQDEVNDDTEVSSFTRGFYGGISIGFATGFWIVFGSLLFSRSWRHIYFNFLNKLMGHTYVTAMLINKARWCRWLNN